MVATQARAKQPDRDAPTVNADAPSGRLLKAMSRRQFDLCQPAEA